MCPTFCVDIIKLFQCLFDSNCNSHGHTYHGVVAGADETHHLYALGDREGIKESMTSPKSFAP